MQNCRPWGHFGVILVLFWCPWAYFDDLGRPRGPPEGAEAKKRQKRASRKVKEGREAKLGSRGLQMAQKSRNGSLQRAIAPSDQSVLEPRAPPWGVGGKINLPPRKEKRQNQTTDLFPQDLTRPWPMARRILVS